jgi:hydroxymethylglutaryl-CoA lyase
MDGIDQLNGAAPPQSVKLIECPRDSWQGLPQTIPTYIKADYLRSLVRAGFRHIDAVSFVSAAAVPQMADSEDVMAALAEDSPGTMDGVEIIGIVVNEKGAERAVASPLVTTFGFPYSVSPTFLMKNQKQTPEQALDVLEAIEQRADAEGRDVVAYVSMAFGNPYGDAWSVDETVAACELLVDLGMTRISLADTVGVASAEQVEEVVAAVLRGGAAAEIGVHLHARPEGAAAKIAAAYRAGCRRFDTALGGVGGCPFAQDALVGNIATEIAIQALQAEGAVLPVLSPLDNLLLAANGIAAKFGQPLRVH